ncbi:MAG: DNA replication and repair protein RecF [Acidobacteria bacterium]|nr:MAG: DNA replication and repair protein RecF [Acidobacteriota bacterium]
MLLEIEVRDLRNLVPQRFVPGGGRHLILGPNGAGKTSLLEAVYLLATTRSFRTPQLADCCRHGADGFVVRGEVEGQWRVGLEVAWRRDDGSRRSVNGKRSSLAEHLAVLPVLAWTAADAEVLAGAPAARRRLLDRGVLGLEPGAIVSSARYRQALRGKRQLLAGTAGAAELAAWNRLLASSAAEIIARRRRYAERLQSALAEVLEGCRLTVPPITLRYRPSPAVDGGAGAVEQALAAIADRERRQQRVLLGPHRDDLEVRWGGRDVRRVASAGERKALGLVLLAAQSRLQSAAGRPPLVLLDDVDSELDPDRLAAVWPAFDDVEQLLATSSRPAVWQPLAVDRRSTCEGGRVRPR